MMGRFFEGACVGALLCFCIAVAVWPTPREIQLIENRRDMARCGARSTPALQPDGSIVCAGAARL